MNFGKVILFAVGFASASALSASAAPEISVSTETSLAPEASLESDASLEPDVSDVSIGPQVVFARREPGWTHGVLLFGEAKAAKDATPILQRDYRPLHFYGNTVRRQYYRGTTLPAPRDLLDAARVTVTRE